MRKILCILVACIVMPWACHAYGSKAHMQINKVILDNELVSINDLLVKAGYQWGINTLVPSSNGSLKMLKDILTEAGAQEDEPWQRTVNHFMDPLGAVSLNGPWVDLVGVKFTADYWATSSYVQNYFATENDIDVWVNMSYEDALEYLDAAFGQSEVYPTAVDGVVTKEVSDRYLGLAFRALGQVMHMVEDMAVPAHTRNDAHPPWDREPYERWCETKWEEIPGWAIEVDKSTSGYDEIRDLFSNCTLDDLNPRQELSECVKPGLADYTSVNFYSQDTMSFYGWPRNNSHGNWNPSKDDIVMATNQDGSPKLNKSGDYIYKFTTVDPQSSNNVIEPYVYERANIYDKIHVPGEYYMGEEVFRAHAEKLIPKAVAMASAVLKKFFERELVPDYDGVLHAYKRTYPTMGVSGREQNALETFPRNVINYIGVDSDGNLHLNQSPEYNESHPSNFCFKSYLAFVKPNWWGYGNIGALPKSIWTDIKISGIGDYLFNNFKIDFIEPKQYSCPEKLISPAPDFTPDQFKVYYKNGDDTFGPPIIGEFWPDFNNPNDEGPRLFRVEVKGLLSGNEMVAAKTFAKDLMYTSFDESCNHGGSPGNVVVQDGALKYDQGVTSCRGFGSYYETYNNDDPGDDLLLGTDSSVLGINLSGCFDNYIKIPDRNINSSSIFRVTATNLNGSEVFANFRVCGLEVSGDLLDFKGKTLGEIFNFQGELNCDGLCYSLGLSFDSCREYDYPDQIDYVKFEIDEIGIVPVQ